MAVMQGAAEALLVPLDKLDRADLPRGVRESLRKSIIGITAAFAEDDDPQKVAPNPASFTRMLQFLEHAHRWSWAPPGIAVSPDGHFSAIWDEPGVHRWILDFLSGGDIQETYLETYPDGRIEYRSNTVVNADEVSPPFRIVRID